MAYPQSAFVDTNYTPGNSLTDQLQRSYQIPKIEAGGVNSFDEWAKNNGVANKLVQPEGYSYTQNDMDLLSRPEVAEYAAGKGLDLNTTEGFNALKNQFGEDNSWGYKEWGTAGNIGLGVGQLGLGLASYLDQSKTAEKQRRLLDQQYANNAYLIANRKAKNDNITSAFGGGK